MLVGENDETRAALLKIKDICHKLNIGIWVVFIVLGVSWLVSAWSILGAFLHGGGSTVLLKLFLSFAFGVVVAVMFVLFSKFFSEVSKGDSPFTLVQVKRLRMMSILLVIYGLLDNAITNCAASMLADGVNSGYISTNTDIVVAVYVAPFIIAAVVFAFSFVFKYGVLLQELSDETL